MNFVRLKRAQLRLNISIRHWKQTQSAGIHTIQGRKKLLKHLKSAEVIDFNNEIFCPPTFSLIQRAAVYTSKNNKNAKTLCSGPTVRLIKPPQDPRLHLTQLGSDERPTAFRYHPPKSIRTDFEFYFEPCFSIGKNNNNRNDDNASNLKDSKITNNKNKIYFQQFSQPFEGCLSKLMAQMKIYLELLFHD